MHFRKAVGFAAAALTSSLAQTIQFTNSDYSGITAGQPFSISWSGDGSPVDIVLLTGPSDNLSNVTTVTSSATSSPFSYTPSTDLPSGTYAFSISQSGSTNYSPQFQITGGTGTSSSSTAVDSPNTAIAATPTPVYVAQGGLSTGANTTAVYGTASASASAGPGYTPFTGAAASGKQSLGMGVVGAVVAMGAVVGAAVLVV